MMAAGKNGTVPTWSQVKAKLAHFDRAGLVGLLGDLHGLSRDNQAFLHARLGLGADPSGDTPEAFARFIRDDQAKWSKLMKEAGIAAPQ